MKLFKKTLIALAITGVTSAAFADVDMTDSTADAVVIATEYDFEFSAMVDGDVFGLVTFDNNGAESNADSFRVELTNGLWGSLITDADIDDESGNGITPTVAAGANSNFFTITLDADLGTSTDKIEVTFDSGHDVTITGESDVTLTVSAHENKTDADADANVLGQDSEKIIDFASAFDVDFNAASSIAKIDTGDESKTFVTNVKLVELGDIDLGLDADTKELNVDEDDDLVAADFFSKVKVEVTGDFTATANVDGEGNLDSPIAYTDADKVWISDSANCDAADGDEKDLTVATTGLSASVELTGADIDSFMVGERAICMSVNGTSAIVPDTYELTVTYTDATGFDSDLTTTATLGTTEKNGGSDEHYFALTPGSNFGSKAYYRFSNLTNVAGDVTITLRNDAGETDTFDLSDIEGVDSDEIGANSATGMISLDKIYDAASDSFDHNGGKLRVSASGEFKEIHIDAVLIDSDDSSFQMLNDPATNKDNL